MPGPKATETYSAKIERIGCIREHCNLKEKSEVCLLNIEKVHCDVKNEGNQRTWINKYGAERLRGRVPAVKRLRSMDRNFVRLWRQSMNDKCQAPCTKFPRANQSSVSRQISDFFEFGHNARDCKQASRYGYQPQLINMVSNPNREVNPTTAKENPWI